MKFKKKDGKVDNYIVLTICLVVIFIAIIISAYNFSDMEKKSKIDRVGRNYIMQMESKGYLSSTDEQELIKELKKLGVTNISTAGTTKTKVDYGEDIFLKVSGKVNINTFKVKSLFDVEKNGTLVDISIDEKSTGKH
ncbi:MULTISPECIES: hypothetical protein [Clostridium]|uniref:hypothetical protein n=1 Tax=Clostridium TaxID=1485 RepID=UPI00232E3260|nr:MULTISPECIES: hypothetical protein [Clostridium]MDB2104989.1 hypothetical protein [Clostridium paraputrificum]MDU2107970.1 hypothetical protein [Clostridium sp.]MDU3355898.1 hypothetical protein [Clostridium sp.]MDU4728164.1 hypothetical protein [Clostridium sp.]